MIVNFLRSGGKDLLASRSALPADNLGKTAFSPTRLGADADFVLGVTNLGTEPQKFGATLHVEHQGIADDVLSEMNEEASHEDLDPDLDGNGNPQRVPKPSRDDTRRAELGGSSRDDEASGIIGRCVDWFVRGIAAAIADRKMVEDKGSVPLGQLLSPARVRDSLRRLVSDLVDVAEIPIEASALYWKQIADLAHGMRGEESRVPSTIGFGPETIAAGSIGQVVVQLAAPMRPRRLRFVPDGNSHRVRIVDVRTGKDSLLLSLRPIPGSFGADGIDIGTDEVAWTSVILEINNPTNSDIDVSGVLEGDRMWFRSET